MGGGAYVASHSSLFFSIGCLNLRCKLDDGSQVARIFNWTLYTLTSIVLHIQHPKCTWCYMNVMWC